MADTRRITPAEVVAAYESTGLKPARTGDDWIDADGCGCGAAAMIKARHPDFCNPHWPFSAAVECLGVSWGYLRGFVAGFDGLPRDYPEWPVYSDARKGYEDGIAAAAAVFGGQVSRLPGRGTPG